MEDRIGNAQYHVSMLLTGVMAHTSAHNRLSPSPQKVSQVEMTNCVASRRNCSQDKEIKFGKWLKDTKRSPCVTMYKTPMLSYFALVFFFQTVKAQEARSFISTTWGEHYKKTLKRRN
jgi:hypothetical protein